MMSWLQIVALSGWSVLIALIATALIKLVVQAMT
jgi:hypothetical protein